MVKRKATGRVSKRSIANVPPYGDPIRQAIATGDRVKMKQMSVATRRWITSTEKQLASVRKALEKLDAVISKL
jgi:hypothetical protein